jgi:hypothetical protein
LSFPSDYPSDPAERHPRPLLLPVVRLLDIEDRMPASAAAAATFDIEENRTMTRELHGVPRAAIARQMTLAERLHGVSRPRMLREMAELAAGPGFMMPSERFL